MRLLQIRLGIAQTTKNGEKSIMLTSEEVKNWRQLIEKARNQSDLAGKTFQVSQLFALVRSMFVITSYVFLILNIPTKIDPRSSRFVVNWTFAMVYQIIRVFLKIRIAEKITTQVKRSKNYGKK